MMAFTYTGGSVFMDRRLLVVRLQDAANSTWVVRERYFMPTSCSGTPDFDYTVRRSVLALNDWPNLG